MTKKEKIISVILDMGDGECPLCNYGAFWGTCNKTGERPADEAAAARLADVILKRLED